jgi:hypothetical protein
MNSKEERVGATPDHDREVEELNFLLSQTPWLEHMVMLAYLFAAFSFKTEVSEGLTEEQLEAVKG